MQAADAFDDLAAAGADQAGDAEDLALPQVEGHVAEAPAVAEAAHLTNSVRRALVPVACFGG